ncbi:MFS transporter [Draconibacterium halophilum]|uniref:Sugar MFS transporter n=1 Tax=Draconibacterium halophilum TaxID=2706887 RepID=A0A6C0REC7_9BACT|nr:MFS transporter [Draconibacterium halophilum]QIA08924.1 sugar MFS transporter [Draconibacterium halophilum]
MEKSIQLNRSNYLLPLAIVSILFFVIGFGIGISGFLTPFLQDAFHLSTSQSYLVTVAIFSAFVIFGAPAGAIIKKVGYKNGMVIAFFIMALGMFLFIPSSKQLSFPLFLLALFIGGIGNTVLQASVNPYVTIIGPKESAAMRMSLMGIMNKSAWWLSSLFLGIFLDLKNVRLEDITLPFYIVTGILLALGVFMIFAPLPEVKAEGEEDSSDVSTGETSSKSSIFQFPHLLLGVAALFVYVGVETLPMVSIIGYAKAVFGDSSMNLDHFSIYVPLGLVIGYLFGVVMIPKYMSQSTALKAFSLIGIGAALLLIFLPGKFGIYAMALIGFANSLMWPAIWPLAIADLGKFTKTGASLLVMGIVGGAVLPFIFGFIIDMVRTSEITTVANYKSAFWIYIPAYLYILFFAVKGSKIRK